MDETEHGPARVSWVAPIARALLKARVGDSVEFATPAGREEIEVLAIAYAGGSPP
ncbi:MAG TPA: GreA/GreB family elongation factor [Stellaceae bacterium]|nr:GreA/GreB family elongation factor [Stellaceae bacterium]